jgi:hypothetical protein
MDPPGHCDVIVTVGFEKHFWRLPGTTAAFIRRGEFGQAIETRQAENGPMRNYVKPVSRARSWFVESWPTNVSGLGEQLSVCYTNEKITR